MIKKESRAYVIVPLAIITAYVLFNILYIGADLIIPFIIALLFSFAIIWLSNFYKRFKINPFFAFILSIWTYIFIFWIIWKIINSNSDELVNLLPWYQEKIYKIYLWLIDRFNIPEPKSISELIQWINLSKIFSMWFSAIAGVFSKAWIILFYVIFILLEYRFFRTKLNLIFSNEVSKRHIIWIIDRIKSDIKSYFVIKSTVSIITWILSFIIMTIFWLEFAVFWAFIIFILNYIPSIWSVIAVSFPVMFSLIQFDSYYVFTFMTIWLIWVQILMWNIIEPRFLWNKLNLSPLVIIISLAFWWSIWWIVWMLLSVPIMVIINIILAEIPATRNLAIILSEKWDIQIEWWEEVVKKREILIKKVKEKFKKKK